MAQEGQIATGPNGETAVYRNGQWVVMAGGPPADPTFDLQAPKTQAQIEQSRASAASSYASAESSRASAAATGLTAEGRAIENEQKRQELKNWEQAQAAKDVRQFLRFDRNMKIINRARDMVRKNGGVGWASLLAALPDNDARDLQSALKPLLADLGFDRLQEMRDASPTGGALGQVSERELDLLQSSMGNLDLGASQEQFLRNLDMVQNQLIGLYASAGGLDSVSDPEAWAERTKELTSSYRPNLTRDDDGAPALGQATGETYATPEDLELQREVQSAFNRGATVDELIDIQERFGRPVDAGRRAILRACGGR